MSGSGVRADQVRIDWTEMMRFKRTFTEVARSRSEHWMSDSGVTMFHGLRTLSAPLVAIQVSHQWGKLSFIFGAFVLA
jgi:glutathione reductase (NADPH)